MKPYDCNFAGYVMLSFLLEVTPFSHLKRFREFSKKVAFISNKIVLGDSIP